MKNFLFLICLLSPLTLWSLPRYEVVPESGRLEFLAVGSPGFLKINGKSTGPKGWVTIENQKVSGELEIPIRQLDTGMALRNDHLQNKYLEADKFPKATLTFQQQPLPQGWSRENPKLSKTVLDGVLSLHGVQKPVRIEFSMSEHADVQAQFKIKLTDYQVDIPSFMGVTVADQVEVNVKTKL